MSAKRGSTVYSMYAYCDSHAYIIFLVLISEEGAIIQEHHSDLTENEPASSNSLHGPMYAGSQYNNRIGYDTIACNITSRATIRHLEGTNFSNFSSKLALAFYLLTE